MRLRILLSILAISVILLGACAAPTPIPGVPDTSASAITLPPPNMEGINTHTQVYGTGAEPYSDKTSMEFEVAQGKAGDLGQWWLIFSLVILMIIGYLLWKSYRLTANPG